MRKLNMDELGRLSVGEFKQATKTPIIVILDNIRSMNNVGSVFRTADAFLLEAICLCGYTPQPPHRDIQKTALGATETVDWLHYNNTIDAIADVKKRGYLVYAVEQVVDSISLETLPIPSQPIAIVMGNEVSGVDDVVLQMCDGCLEIPQLGSKHSLNISVAAGIVIWKLTEFTLLAAK